MNAGGGGVKGCADGGGVDKEEPQVKVGGGINNGDTVTCRAADGDKKEGARTFRDGLVREIALEGRETGIDGTGSESVEDEPIASAIVLFGGK